MINLEFVKKFCKDYTLIENYNEAVNDTTQTWICHHILGEILSKQQLLEHDFYYNVPPCMLKFVTKSEHNSIHHLGKSHTEYTRKKMSASHKGLKQSEESRRKMSESRKGKKFTEEHRKKLAIAAKKRWANKKEVR